MSDFVINNGILEKYTGSDADVIIPDGVTGIAMYAFERCRSVVSVTIPDGVKSIESDAFYFCVDLQSVTIPESAAEIDSSVFGHCYSLRSLYFKNRSADEIPEEYRQYQALNGFLINRYTDGASEAAVQSFVNLFKAQKYNWGLECVLENRQILLLALEYALLSYEDADLLLSLLPDNHNAEERVMLIEYMNKHFSQDYLLELTDRVFSSGYVPLKTVAAEWRFAEDADGHITLTMYVGDKTQVRCPEKIGDKPVTAIGAFAFSGCGIEEIFIPDSVAAIGDKAFYYCRNLRSVVIPDSVKFIGSGAFYYCTSLESVNLPTGITSLSQAVFSHSGLKSIVIPDSVTDIGPYAFSRCYALKSAVIPGTAANIDYRAFARCFYLESVTITDSTAKIKRLAFDNCKRLKTVIITGNPKIENNAFYSCYRLSAESRAVISKYNPNQSFGSFEE